MIRVEPRLSWHNRGPVTVVAPRLAPAPQLAVVLVGAGDPESTRLVYAMVIGLVVIGVVLIFLGVWILRQTKPDLEVLAPLERMGDGDWKKKDPSTQRRILDELRPEGAEPLAPASLPPSIDQDFEQTDHPVTSFSDLGPGVATEQRDPTPIKSEIETLGTFESDEVDEVDAVDAVDAVDQVDQVDQVDEVDEVDESVESDVSVEVDDAEQAPKQFG